ncbi:hypothetical protein CZ674_02955 [Agrococcus casei LMG 22410]|uniref:Uncharacterized protein n=1 Tax=Agrococcus casei LMG 22410 TaxID=1255656 RepID=A0A1R4F802_9MICO|nr:hypothetical protein CZ674_02955 [Agrococcus casei LMG 22410]
MLTDRGIIESTGGIAALPFGQRVTQYRLTDKHAQPAA